jgi:hypothetical protein
MSATLTGTDTLKAAVEGTDLLKQLLQQPVATAAKAIIALEA